MPRRYRQGYFLENLAYQVCLEAAKEKGQDQEADINCIKYFTTMRKECWPCVCEIAKEEGWKVKGCDLFSTNIRLA